MGIWPELRSAYNTRTGKELARSNLDDFLGFVLEYSINSGENSHRMREAMYKTVYNEPVEGAEFTMQTVASLEDELKALDRRLREGVE